MLQPTALQPDKATSSLSVIAHSDLFPASPARMSVSRLCIDISTIPTSGLPELNEYIRECCFATTELEKQKSGMSVTTGAHSKRSYIAEVNNNRDSAEYVECGGPTTRVTKRREVSLEGDSRSDRYTTSLFADHHHHLQSGGSDLTTEQSAVFMAADESNSTRSTSSLNEDGYLLNINSAIPPVSRYGDLCIDTDEDDQSSKLASSEAAASEGYLLHSLHATWSTNTHFPSSKEGHWLASATCATFNDHMQHHDDLHDDTEGCDANGVDAETDWLELRLGHNVACRDGAVHKSRSISPCTLQLLPEKPDCAAVMKERDTQSELKLCCGEPYEEKTSATTMFEQEDIQQIGRTQARPPLMTYLAHVNQPAIIVENHQQFYTTSMQASGLPMHAAANCTGEYIASGGRLPIRHNSSTINGSLNPRILTVDRPSSHVQQLLKDTGFQCRRPQLDMESTLQSRDGSLHGLAEGPSTFKSMVCSSLHEGFSGSPIQRTRSAPPLPDFLQQNWDLLAPSTSPLAPSCSMLQVAAAPTCFRELIASSFVKEPLSKLEYGNAPLMSSIPKPQLPCHGDGLTVGEHMNIWPCNKLQSSHSHSSSRSSLNINYSNDLAMTANERINTSNMNGMECSRKSMSEWLSQAISATTFNSVNQRALKHEDIDQFDAHYIHGTKSKYHSSLKLSTGRQGAAARGSPGFWFALQPSGQESEGLCLDQGAGENKEFMHVLPKTSYIRLKNGNVSLSVVKKFLIAKLGLSEDSQVGFSCRGKLLDECSYLKRIQDDIWIQPTWMQIETMNFKSIECSNIPKDNVMILTYQILK